MSAVESPEDLSQKFGVATGAPSTPQTPEPCPEGVEGEEGPVCLPWARLEAVYQLEPCPDPELMALLAEDIGTPVDALLVRLFTFL